MGDRYGSQYRVVPTRFLDLMLSKTHFEFRVVDALGMFVKLRTASAPRDRKHFGNFEHHRFNATGDPLAFR